MTKKLQSMTLTLASLVMLGGCLNMPTPPSQITGSYTSGLRYENFDCSRLSVELDSLARRENQLVIAVWAYRIDRTVSMVLRSHWLKIFWVSTFFFLA